MTVSRLVLAALLVVFQLVPAVPADARPIVTASSRVELFTVLTTPNLLKPVPECAGITLNDLDISPGGTFNGTGNNSLTLGTPNADTLKAGKGTDCILGGAGNDALDGGGGIDVCIGGLGTDTFAGCETQIQ